MVKCWLAGAEEGTAHSCTRFGEGRFTAAAEVGPFTTFDCRTFC